MLLICISMYKEDFKGGNHKYSLNKMRWPKCREQQNDIVKREPSPHLLLHLHHVSLGLILPSAQYRHQSLREELQQGPHLSVSSIKKIQMHRFEERMSPAQRTAKQTNTVLLSLGRT